MSSGSRSIASKSCVFACSRALLTGLVLALPVSIFAATSSVSTANIAVKVETPGQALIAGAATQFVIRVSNTGGVSEAGNRLSVPIPTGLQNLTWSCSATSGSHCPSAAGSGALDESLQGLGSGSTLEYVFRADVSDSAPAFVDVSAQAALAGAARCASKETAPCRSSLSLATGPGVMLDIRAQSAAGNPGQQVRYTVSAATVSTRSSSAGTVLRSPVPNGLINSSWRCRSNVGACSEASGQGSINQVLGNFSQGSVSFDVTATVAPNAPASIVQAAVAVPPYGGSCAIARNGAMRFQSSPCTARNVLATSAKILISRSEDYRADTSSIATRFVLDNNGASANGSVVDAALAAGVSRLDWTCVGEGATCPQASGSGAIHQTVTSWPTSGRLTFDLISQVASSARSKATNTLQVTPPARGSCAAGGSSESCDALYSIIPTHGGLKLNQSVDSLGANSGDDVTYRINLGNASSAATARNVVLHVPLPDGIDKFESWTCSAGSASSTACPKASGSGAISEMFAQLAPSSDLSYVIQARVGARPPATVSSRATLTAPASAGIGCGAINAVSHACVAGSQFSTVPLLALDQSISATTLAPGSMVDYILDVFNLGAKADLVQVRNFLPRGVSNISWACSGLGMGCPAVSGNGNITTKLGEMPSGSGVRYHVSAQVDENQPESATSVLAAVPGRGGRCHNQSPDSASCVDRISSSYAPKLELIQSADEQQLLRGGVIHHSLTLKNIGGPTLDTRLALPMASGIKRSSWTCSGFGGAVCPQVSGTGAIDARIASLPFNAYLNYSIRSVLSADAPSSILSVATTTPGAKALCADEGCESTLSLPVTDVPAAHLQMTIDASANIAHPGASTTWSVDVRNLGSERSGPFSLSNVMTGSAISIDSWTCSGAECPAAEGNGPISQTIASLSIYEPTSSDEAIATGRLHFVVTGTISQHPDSGAEFAYKIQPAQGDTCAPVSCLASSTLPSELLGASEITLDVVSNDFEVFPNSTINYEYTVFNTGGAEVAGVPVYTTDPVGVVSSSWSCVSSGSAVCPTIGSGSGEINEMIPSMPAGSSVTFLVSADTDTTIPDDMEFIVGANPAQGVLCNPTGCMTSFILTNGQEELNLSMTADVGFVEPGSTINYTFVLTNAGPGDAFDIVIAGLDSPSFSSSSWTCTSDGKSSCMPTGSGQLDDYFPYLGQGESATYTVTATVGSTLPSSIDYQVQISPGQPGNAPQGTFNCVPASCGVSVSLPTASPTVELSMVFNSDEMGAGSFDYTIDNAGPADVFNVQVYGVDAPDFSSSSWTCAGTGTTCTPSGTGELDDFIAFLPANTSVTYTVTPEFGQVLPATADYTAGVISGSGQGGSNSPQGSTPFGCIPAECFVSVSAPIGLPAPAMFTITKSADRSTLTPGGSVRYTVRFANTGSADAGMVQLLDAIPNGLTSFNWTCSASGNASCEQTSGSGALNQTVQSFAQGSSLTYTVDATVSPSASGSVNNRARLVGDNVECSPSSCQAVSSLPVELPSDIIVSKSASPAAGSTISPGEPVEWTISTLNSGGPTRAILTLNDVLPASVSNLSVTPDQGVSCNNLSPEPGSTLTCTIDAGFSGQVGVVISATVAVDATGALVNSVSATGISDINCDSCSVSNPVNQAIDLALMNPRPFSAGGVAGTLIDVVNLSPTPSSMAQLSVSPASSLRLLAPFASACTTTIDDEGNVSVSCPSPSESEGIQCSAATCLLDQVSQGGALTVFVALNGSSAATVQISAPGDSNGSNNSIELSSGGTP